MEIVKIEQASSPAHLDFPRSGDCSQHAMYHFERLAVR